MSRSNIEIIRDIYDAFAAGDIPAVLHAMDVKVVWNEAENFPYADGNPYIGPQAVAEGVFARCVRDWDGFGVQMTELLDAGDTVVALGRYIGTHRVTGRTLNPQIVHVWRLENGKVIAFQQHADTLHVARASGAG